jgi:hypothetical protein
MTDIPAGWYDDPEHPSQFRYWDGAAWTDHRSPKTAGGSDDGVWTAVSDAFRLIGRGWRELVVLSLPLIIVTVAAGLLVLASLEAAVEPGIGDILDRMSEPGFDPFNNAADEDFIESIDLSIGVAVVGGLAVAALLFFVVGTAVSVTFTVFLAALRRGVTLPVNETYRICLPRLPRILGILILWTLGAMAVLVGAAVLFAVGVVISRFTLLVLLPATLAAIIFLYPYGALATTTLSVAPTDDPPLRRTITLVSRRWGFIAIRLLVLTLVFWIIGFGSNVVTTPFGAASVWAGFLVSMILRAVQTVLATAGNVVLYDLAEGPLDASILTRDQSS